MHTLHFADIRTQFNNHSLAQDKGIFHRARLFLARQIVQTRATRSIPQSQQSRFDNLRILRSLRRLPRALRSFDLFAARIKKRRPTPQIKTVSYKKHADGVFLKYLSDHEFVRPFPNAVGNIYVKFFVHIRVRNRGGRQFQISHVGFGQHVPFSVENSGYRLKSSAGV